MPSKFININPPENYRIIAISDIHGNHDVFKALIDRLDLHENDYLIIMGDFINRGDDSYKTYHLVRELSKRRNTFVLKGNHEYYIHKSLENENYFDHFFKFLHKGFYETIIDSSIKKAGLDLSEFESSHGMLEYILENEGEMYEFLKKLPIIITIDHFLFVHGGYNSEFDIIEDEGKFLKYDDFNSIGEKNEKITVVGHWPASNLHTDKITNMPYFNDEKQFIFIDGGMGVTNTGELNAFIIEKKQDCIRYDLKQQNSFKKSVIRKKHYFESEPFVNIYYPHNQIEVIELGQLMSKCKQVDTQIEFSTFTSLLVKKDSNYSLVTDFNNCFFNLEIGDEVEICKTFEACVLVKYKDTFGWVLREQLE